MSHRAYDRGWRDGFYGREPREACSVYLDGWHAGLAKGDRTERPAPAPRFDRPACGPDEAGEPLPADD